MHEQVSNVSEVRASGQLLMRGAMGVTIQGSQVDITAQGDVSVSSEVTNASCFYCIGKLTLVGSTVYAE